MIEIRKIIWDEPKDTGVTISDLARALQRTQLALLILAGEVSPETRRRVENVLSPFQEPLKPYDPIEVKDEAQASG